MKKYFMILIFFICCGCSVTKDEITKSEYLCRNNKGLNSIYFSNHYGAECNDGTYIPLNDINKNFDDYVKYLKKTQSPNAE